MLNIEYHKDFLKKVSKIIDRAFKAKVIAQVEKIIENPELGKPMRFNRKGTRELYVSPYRIAYAYIHSENRLIFLDLYHKDEQ